MAEFSSPGINVTEIDLTRVPITRSTSVGALAGVFTWGPVGERIRIASVAQLTYRFGAPRKNVNQETWFTAHDYLAYSDNLLVVRADSGATYAAPSETSAFYASPDALLTAKYPGTNGNSLTVRIVSRASWNTLSAAEKALATKIPGRRAQTDTIDPNDSDDLYHVFVIDTYGWFSGKRGKLLEKFENVSDEENARREGASIFMIDVINTKSRYIKFNIESTDAGEATLKSQLGINDITNPTGLVNLTVQLQGAGNGSTESGVSLNQVLEAYNLFTSVEEVDVSFLMQGKARGSESSNYTDLANHLINIAEARKDCIAFVSPDRADVVNNTGGEVDAMVAFSNSMQSSTYAVLDSGYKYRYDRYNDQYIYTPLNADIAGLCARTDVTNDPWMSPAGYNRGIIKNVVRLAFNPYESDRDQLYINDINPVITQSGTGTILFGDKTHVLDADTATAFDRINIRRLFITIERVISRAAKNLLFEMNNEFTRTQFLNIVEPYLRNVQGRQGIYDYRVVCDETNNTPEVIDANQFVGDIYVKPARSINYIQLNFVAVRTGVEFEEVVGTI